MNTSSNEYLLICLARHLLNNYRADDIRQWLEDKENGRGSRYTDTRPWIPKPQAIPARPEFAAEMRVHLNQQRDLMKRERVKK